MRYKFTKLFFWTGVIFLITSFWTSNTSWSKTGAVLLVIGILSALADVKSDKDKEKKKEKEDVK